MASWRVDFIGKKPVLRNPIMVEGLPGIGNVGKVAVDFIIEELHAKKIAEFTSYSLPHTVFVKEDNLVELPKIELFFKELKNQKNDVLLVSGDIQPIDEESCYSFCDTVLDVFQQFKGSNIVTLGGIAMRTIPEKPLVFCTGNNKPFIEAFKKHTAVNDKLYGVVGPIIGVSGVLLGLAERRKLAALALLAETYGHPLYIGAAGAREIVNVLNKKLGLNVNVEALDKEIVNLEKEMKQRTQELSEIQKKSRLQKIKNVETSYIG